MRQVADGVRRCGLPVDPLEPERNFRVGAGNQSRDRNREMA